MPKKPRDVQKEKTRPSAKRATPQAVAPATRSKKAPSRKAAGKKSPTLRKEPRAKPKAADGQPLPSDEQIRLRAYFIAERRTRLSLPGDNHSDWLEAKRQLFEEAGIRLN